VRRAFVVPVTVWGVTGAMSGFLANIPSPDQGVWELGPIPIRMYALCIIVAIIVAIWWGERRLVARGAAPGTVVDVAVWAVPFGLIGGRLYHVITDYYRYFGEGKDPIRALYIWEGGLGIWGAIALGGVGALIGCRRRGIPLPAFADAVAPCIVLAQAIGRLGNYFNQELYGGETTLPWGLEIYQRVNPDTGMVDQLNGVAVNHTPIAIVHPTFLYELLWNIGVAALVVYADRKLRLGHGRAFALYVAGYTLGRTWIELMRTDEATMVAGMRINVWVSILVFIGAVVYFIQAAKKGPREDLAALREQHEAAGAEATPGASAQAAATDTAATNGSAPADEADSDKAEETKAEDAKADKVEDTADEDAKAEPEKTEEAKADADEAGTEKSSAEKPGESTIETPEISEEEMYADTAPGKNDQDPVSVPAAPAEDKDKSEADAKKDDKK
jgi:prolipoprotein diacylglyceryl transferase